jgi:hypothetical protein
VSSVHRKLSTLALIVALVSTLGANLVGWGTEHEVCATQHHECDDTARIAQCCCGHVSDASNLGGPVETRVRLTVDLSPLPVALPAGTFADATGTSLQIHTPPASRALPDFVTRFAPLLI